jgi:hypothetical protein
MGLGDPRPCCITTTQATLSKRGNKDNLNPAPPQERKLRARCGEFLQQPLPRLMSLILAAVDFAGVLKNCLATEVADDNK